MRFPTMHRALLFAVVAAASFTACATEIEPFVAPPHEAYTDAEVSRGEDVYLRTCATCHGRHGGGGVGPNVRQVWERLTPDEHLRVVVEGRKKMPAFGRNLTDEDLAAVVAYQRFGWSDPTG